MSSTVDPSRPRLLPHGSGKARGNPTAAPPGPSTVAADAPRRSLEPLSLRRNFSWIVAGNAVSAMSLWGIVVLLTRLGGLETVGRVMLAFAVCAPLSALAKLGLCGVLVTDAKGEYRFGDYLGLRLITVVLGSLVVIGIAVATRSELELALLILIVGLGDVFESVSEIFHGLMQRHERMDRVGVALMIRGPLKLLLLAIGLLLTGEALWGIAGVALVSATTLFIWDVPNGWRILRSSQVVAGQAAQSLPDATSGLSPRLDARTLLKLAWVALPLGVVAAMLTLFGNLPRYMVSHYLGDRGLGIFVPVVALGMLPKMVAAGIGQSSSPRLAKHYALGNTAAFYRLLGKLLAASVCLGAGLVLLIALAGGPILVLLYGAPFHRHADLALYLMAAAGLLYLSTPLAKAVQATRRFKTHMLIRSSGILILLVLLPGLIEAYGLNGAAGAMLIGSSFLVLAYGLAVLLIVRPPGALAPKELAQPSACPGPGQRLKSLHVPTFDNLPGFHIDA